MRGIGGGRGDDHAEFSFKTSLRICAFANFGRRLDVRLFIPAALRLASSTSLFAHLIGRSPSPPLPSPLRKRLAHSAEWLFIQTFPSSAILHGFINASKRGVKSRRYLYFSPSPLLPLSLFLCTSIDFNFSRVHAVATSRKNLASIPVKFARTRLSIFDRLVNNARFVPFSETCFASIRQSRKLKASSFILPLFSTRAWNYRDNRIVSAIQISLLY